MNNGIGIRLLVLKTKKNRVIEKNHKFYKEGIWGEKLILTHIIWVSLEKLLTFLSLSFFISNTCICIIYQSYWYKRPVLILIFNLGWLPLLFYCCCGVFSRKINDAIGYWSSFLSHFCSRDCKDCLSPVES